MIQNPPDSNTSLKYLFGLEIDKLVDIMDQLTFIFTHFLKIQNYGTVNPVGVRLKYGLEFL